MNPGERTHAEERKAIKERLSAIQFADRSQANFSADEREAVWQAFYGNAADDLAYLLDFAEALIAVIGSAADIVGQINHKNPRASEMRRALQQLERFLNANISAATQKGPGV